MFLLDLLSARGICLAYTNYHRLSREIKGETPQCGPGQGWGNVSGDRDSATRSEAHFMCCLKIDMSRFLRFLPYSVTPTVLL